MPYPVSSKIETELVQAAVLPRGIGFAITDEGWIEVTSACCSALIRFFQVGESNKWRCSRCDWAVAKVSASYPFPSGCRVRLVDIDPSNRFDLAQATEWVSKWAACPLEDVEVVFQ